MPVCSLFLPHWAAVELFQTMAKFASSPLFSDIDCFCRAGEKTGCGLVPLPTD
jgi:hypothetical protein